MDISPACLVVACRGAIEVVGSSLGIINGCRDFDAALKFVPSTFRELKKARPEWAEGEIFVMGFSPSKGHVDGFRIGTDDDFEPQRCGSGQLWLSPLPEPSALAAAGLLRDGALAIGGDPIKTLLEVVKVQNAMVTTPCDDPSGPPGHYVGGTIMVTIVTEDMIQQKVVYRFPDSAAGPVRVKAAA